MIAISGRCHDTQYFLGCIQRSNARDGKFYRNAAEVIAFLFDLASIGNRIEYHVYLAKFQILFAVFALFMDLLDDFNRNSKVLEIGTCTGCTDQTISEVDEPAGKFSCFGLIAVADGNQDIAMGRNSKMRSNDCL